jgi:hypothetical protein
VSGEPVECASSIQSPPIKAAIIALFRVINRYVGILPPMPGVFAATGVFEPAKRAPGAGNGDDAVAP